MIKNLFSKSNYFFKQETICIMSGIKQMKQKATGINYLMKFQKINITRNVDKFLTLLDHFKQEQNSNSSRQRGQDILQETQ